MFARALPCILFLILSTPYLSMGQQLDALKIINQENQRLITNTTGKLDCVVSSLDRVRTSIARIQAITSANRSLAARLSLSYSGKTSEASGSLPAREKQDLSTSIDISRGAYPDQIRLRSSIGVTRTETGALSESLSDLHLSYDYHLRDEHLEAFVFGKRFSDDYLGIDQRYEIGGGVVFNGFFGGYTSTGRKQLGEIFHGTATTPTHGVDQQAQYIYNAAEAEWRNCYLEIANKGGNVGTPEIAASELRTAANTASRIIRKARTKVRLGLLMGIHTELEDASIDTSATTPAVKVPSEQGWRFEIRPRAQFQPIDGLRFRADWFLKWSLNGFRRDRFDIRGDILGLSFLGNDVRSELTLSVVARVGNAAIELSHQINEDSLPPWFVDDSGELLVARRNRNTTVVRFNIIL